MLFRSGTAVTHTAGSSDFTLTENGTYEIRYSTTATPGAGATPPVTAQVSLQQDGTPIAGTTSSNTIAAAGQTAALSGSAVVNVTAAPVTITLVNGTADVDYTNSSVVVRKLD